MLISYLKVFVVGGAICIIGQILVDKTNLTPARILTSYVVAGTILGAVGVYGPLAEWAGAGATVPIIGFGNLLAEGTRKAVEAKGLLGAFTGGCTSASAGVTAAIFFGLIISTIFKSREKD